MRNHRKILSLLLICLLLLTACGRPGRNTADPQAETGTFIYYLNNERTTLKTSEYKLPENMEEEDVLDDMLDNLAAPFADGIAPISGFTLQGRSLDKGMLILDFSEEYEQLDALDEILIRGAIVKRSVSWSVSGRYFLPSIRNPWSGTGKRSASWDLTALPYPPVPVWDSMTVSRSTCI